MACDAGAGGGVVLIAGGRSTSWGSSGGISSLRRGSCTASMANGEE